MESDSSEHTLNDQNDPSEYLAYNPFRRSIPFMTFSDMRGVLQCSTLLFIITLLRNSKTINSKDFIIYT